MEGVIHKIWKQCIKLKIVGNIDDKGTTVQFNLLDALSAKN